MKRIRVAIVGVGNCASALIQGIEHYKRAVDFSNMVGLAYPKVGPYMVGDVEISAAFDIDSRKVGRDVSEAIFSKPNCTLIFHNEIPNYGVPVRMGCILGSVAMHTAEYPGNDRIIVADKPEMSKKDIVKVLRESGSEILVNYLPVGSKAATEFYTECALSAGLGMVNCIPVFIASSVNWATRFEDCKLPIIGDDIKSQVGATVLHRTLVGLFGRRGATVDHTYQLNVGGNTDFLSMLDRSRLASKKISKTEAVQSAAINRIEDTSIHIGPSDYVAWMKDNKVCFLRMEGKGFGSTPIELEIRLSVQDSPNSAGIVIDAIRFCRIALDREISGVLDVPSACFCKHPPKQMNEETAFQKLKEFILDGN